MLSVSVKVSSHLPGIWDCGVNGGENYPASKKNVLMFYIFNGNIQNHGSIIDFKDWIENIFLQ